MRSALVLLIWGGCGRGAVAPIDQDRDGSPAGVDCDDSDPARSPELQEVCDGIDNDCDGLVDDDDIDSPPADRATWHPDRDADGHGDATIEVMACEAPPDHIVDGTDCDDADPAIAPGLDDVCDGLDNDCDTVVDVDVFPRDFASLQDAVDLVSGEGGTICVAPGVHPGTATIVAGSVTIRSASGPELTSFDLSGLTESFIQLSASGELTIAGLTVLGADNASGSSTIQGAFVYSQGTSIDGPRLSLQDVVIDSPRIVVSDRWISGGVMYLGEAETSLSNVEVRRARVELDGEDPHLFGAVVSARGGTIETDRVSIANSTLSVAPGVPRCKVDGGLVYVFASGEARLDAFTLTDNDIVLDCVGEGVANGGLLHVQDSNLRAEGWVFRDNVVEVVADDANTFGLVLVESGTSSITSASVERNRVASSGVTSAVAHGGLSFEGSATAALGHLGGLSNVVEAHATDGPSTAFGGVVSHHSAWELDLRHVDVRANRATAEESYGGAIYTTSIQVTGSNLLLVGNQAGGGPAERGLGGGMFRDLGFRPFVPEQTIHLDHVDFVANRAEGASGAAGAGLFVLESTVTLTHSSASSNEVVAPNPKAAALWFGVAPTVAFTNTFANTGADATDWGDLPPGIGNLQADPQYVDMSDPDVSAWDLHLSNGSPLIDAGDPDSAELDPDGSIPDIGAYGGPLADQW